MQQSGLNLARILLPPQTHASSIKKCLRYVAPQHYSLLVVGRVFKAAALAAFELSHLQESGGEGGGGGKEIAVGGGGCGDKGGETLRKLSPR
jgi:hypothetical protein